MIKRVFIILVGMVTTSYAGTRLMINYKPSPQEQLSLNSASYSTQLRARQSLMQPLNKTKISRLESKIGHKFKDINYLATGGRIIELDADYSATEIQNIIKRLKLDPSIQSVEEDIILYPALFETSRYQWGMFNTTSNVPNQNPSTYYGDNFYDSSTNNNPNTDLLGKNGDGITVAVIDTGYVPHPNFISQLSGYSNTQTSGYTFMSDCRMAGTCPVSQVDGSMNYFVNALDLGDGYPCSEYNASANNFKVQCPNTCDAQYASLRNSSWHGTHVTGTIAGQGSSLVTSANNGVLGAAYKANVLPVRVLGKCGGYFSDIINAMLWASGVSSSQDIPLPEKPARVINLSLGGSASCDMSMQNAVDLIVDNGGIVVVAAGNQAQNMSGFVPANCNNVISVAAVGPDRKLAYYSNWGSPTIAASGGSTSFTNGSILSTLYASTTTFNACVGSACYNYVQYQGTSMATPNVVGLIADMLSVNYDLDYTQIRDILQDSSESFTTCSTGSKCVDTGRINARRTMEYVTNQIPVLDSNVSEVEFSAESGSLTQDIIVSNDTTNPITLGSFGFTGQNASSFQINSATCESGLILNQNQSCTITISPITTSNSFSQALLANTQTLLADFEVYNFTGYRILYIPISYAYNDNPPPEPSPSPSPSPEPSVVPSAEPSTAPLVPSSGGGGCTALANGSDYGLLLLLALAWVYRRYKHKISNE